MTFTIGQRVLTATSNPFTENRRGWIADILPDDIYVMDDRGLRLLLHASELVPDDAPSCSLTVQTRPGTDRPVTVACGVTGTAHWMTREGAIRLVGDLEQALKDTA